MESIYEPAPKKARVEIIPLIDVVFFLLATFVLFTLSLNKITSIVVPLPGTVGQTSEDDIVFLQASDAGTFYWKQGTSGRAELISAAEIPGRLADYRRRAGNPRVVIRSDGQAKMGPAVMMLDEVRQAGISLVSVETLVSAPGS
jgi:biopolymer transport protein ExbD